MAEYPFKDLLPLDEVLEREGYYNDWTHLDPEVFYSLTQISEYIKTKGYGVDVRLLIAQLAEHFGLKTTQVVDLANLLQQKFENLEGVTQSFTNNINSLVAQMEADKNTIVANATVDSEVILARGGKDTLGERLDKEHNEVTAKLAQTRKYENVIHYGADPTGVVSSYTAFWDAIQEANRNDTTVLIPVGEYLIDNTIDFTTLPYIINSDFGDYSYRIKIEGEDINKTIIRAGVGLTTLFNYTPTSLQRSFTFSNIRIRPKADYTAQNKVDMIVFQLFKSSASVFENIDLRGFDRGFHLTECWSSIMDNVKVNLCNKGIYIDGRNPNRASGGFADQVKLNRIQASDGVRDYGLRIEGSRGSEITTFNAEKGSTGNAIQIIACQSLKIDGFYIENYSSIQPFLIEGYSPLKNLRDFSSDIAFSNGHVWNPNIAVFRLKKGIKNLTVKNTSFKFNDHPPTAISTHAPNLFSFDSVSEGLGLYYQNIDVFDNSYYSYKNYSGLVEGNFSLVAVSNGKIVSDITNLAYFNITLQSGFELINPTANTRKIVKKPGTHGNLTLVSGSTTANSNIVTVNNADTINVGTYITIGNLERVQVMSKDLENNIIIIGDNATSTQTDVDINYCVPVLV